MKITLTIIVVIIIFSIMYFFNKNEKEKMDRLIKEQENRQKPRKYYKAEMPDADLLKEQENINKYGNIIDESNKISDEDWVAIKEITSFYRDLIINSKSPEEENTNKNNLGMMLINSREEGKLKLVDRFTFNTIVKYGVGTITEKELDLIFNSLERKCKN